MTNEYIAGFFDGEGTIFVLKNTIRLSISQANFEVLAEIQRYLGFGGIRADKRRNPKWKQSWTFYTRNRTEAYKILILITDHLLVKRQKCISAIKIIESINHENEKRKKLILKAYDLVINKISYRKAEQQTGVSRQSICRYVRRQEPLNSNNTTGRPR